PLLNLSGDQRQDYFSDGITDQLITELSRVPGLLVIAATSSRTYKGKAVRVQEVGRELGVEYILEGGLQRIADRIRINFRLIEAGSGEEIWTQGYNRNLGDLFAIEDEIVHKTVNSLKLEVNLWEQGFYVVPRTENPDAYDEVLRGGAYLLNPDSDSNAKAQ